MCLRYDYFSDISLEASHILIAGRTGAGKSVALADFILSACLTKWCWLILIDPKRVELMDYENTKNCICYADTLPKIVNALHYAKNIMNDRFAQMKRRRQKVFDGPDCWVCIDELADLMGNPEIRSTLITISRLGRAARVHLVCCTQSPNRNTLPADLTMNFSHRIGLNCTFSIESRQIIGTNGCESLPPHGLALVLADGKITEQPIGIYPEEEKRKTIHELEIA